MNRNSTKGFTLIELLVVIAIIGLLSTLAIIALNSARIKSRDAKRVSDIKQSQTALELYFADKSKYPAKPGTNGELGVDATRLCGGTPDGYTTSACGTTATDATYMGQVPKDPTSSGNYKYLYAPSVSQDSYTITFYLEGQVGSLAAGSHTASPNGIQ